MSEPARPPADEVDEIEEAELAALGPLLDRLEELLGEVEELDDPARGTVFELLDGIDALHRLAITRVAAKVGNLAALRQSDPAISWLLEAYGVGVDDPEAARTALDQVRPYLHSHGGEVEVLAVRNGVVLVQLTGACSGCTASAVTLREGVEEALRDRLPGFVAMEVVPDSGAPAHPPPTQVLLQITPRPE